jgi:DNA-binding HxlR family transcriptional regulator
MPSPRDLILQYIKDNEGVHAANVFSYFQHADPPIGKNIVSDTLNALVADGSIERREGSAGYLYVYRRRGAYGGGGSGLQFSAKEKG